MHEMNKRKYKILVVDDSRFNRVVLTSMLGSSYYLEEACDGRQAMTILEDHAEEFSLILLDIVMPNMDGFAFLRAMRAEGWLDFLPVIMISSEYTDENIEAAYRLGASDIIRRPYNERIVLNRIANTIALSSKQRELSNALVNEVIQENETSAAMVSILSHIVETRNGESGDHVQNIRTITRLLLEELTRKSDRYSFTNEELLLICNAAALHDIGKMTIPEEILNKPGKLTDEEFRIMKGHAMAGADMVDALCREESANPLFKLTYDICRWHHERYDGRGYPDGLKGDDIPIAAQVVSVADVYDALVSERCYKPAHTPEQAYRMIMDGECGVFNPLLLDCFSGIFDKLKRMRGPAGSPGLAASGADAGQELIEGAIAHLHENGLIASEQIMQTLSHERLRFKFFFNEPYPAFYYTVSPPVLRYNRAGMKLFGTEEALLTPDGTQPPHERYDAEAAERLRRRLASATNEHPLVKETVLLSLPGEQPREYRCEMQTVWDSADAGQYTEVIGRLVPLDGEAAGTPADDDRGELPAFGGKMSGREALLLINALKFMVYNVRLVDPADATVVEIDDAGRPVKRGHACYQIWKQEHRCANCTSMKCLEMQKEFSKIVFLDNEVFHVISQYVEVEGKPLVLETLTRITEDALLTGEGERLPTRSISDMHNKLYIDAVTQAHNRRYYNTKALDPDRLFALAILNVDHFKDINDAYGRAVGDRVLNAVARAAEKDIRKSDALVRYYGDEFVIMFADAGTDELRTTLERISADIDALSVEGVEDGRRITVSIGGAVGPDRPAELLKRADGMLRKAKQHRGSIELCGGEGAE